MPNFLLIPDSFKGSMSSGEVCERMERGIRRVYPQAGVRSVPVADGGEGTVDAFLAALGGEKRFVEVSGPFGEKIPAFYGWLANGTAVVEMAACAGLPQVEGMKNPEKTTTYGVGELLLEAASRGARKIILGLGGSCTNDGGCGAAAACGVRFYDASGKAFLPTGGTLTEVAAIDVSARNPLLDGVEIVTMCDIDNPLFGPEGAAFVFAPQKGADAAMVARLDAGLQHLSHTLQKMGIAISKLPGAGAAGGMGGGMAAFWGSRLQMGIDAVLDAVSLETLLKDTDMVFTGEGRLDTQSLRGKVVLGVSRRVRPFGVPVVAIVGDVEGDVSAVYAEGITAVFSTNRRAVPFSEAQRTCREDLDAVMENLMRFIDSARRHPLRWQQ
ncbi:MAG: glycerate kinase [Planctomycetia bacterium]|nr:glycerate kinase [Planctomycetia bacterium]